MTKEEIIAAIKECTEKQGHVPSFPELQQEMGISKRALRSNFGKYAEALRACGLERLGAGYEVSRQSLFADWAGLARQLGKVPSITEYELKGRYSIRPMLRCFRGWRFVPAGMLEYARKERLEGAWGDVLDIITQHLGPGQRDRRRSIPTTSSRFRARALAGAPMYGEPLMHEVFFHAPTNESGVLLLFGAEAKNLGFKILRAQQECPDCEAMREVEPGKWQRVRIEFEYESRNFLAHAHSTNSCDLIVCWTHNWENCPLEVLELKAALSNQQSAIS